MKVIATRFYRKVDGRAACLSLFSIESVRDDINFLYRFGWRNINRVRRQPGINDARTINLGVVLQTRHAVDVVRLRALRIAGSRVIFSGAVADEEPSCTSCGARYQRNQTLIVSTHT